MKPQKKIKAWIHKIIMMTKEEKIQPIIVPTDKEKLLDGKVALIQVEAAASAWRLQKHLWIVVRK